MRSTHLVTRNAVQQMKNAQHDNPALLAVAVGHAAHYAKSHRDADEVTSLAASLVAAFLPERYRLGYGPTYANRCPAEEWQPVGRHAARQAAARAAAAIAEDHRAALSLDALADADPLALADMTPRDEPPAALALPGQWTPDPERIACTTPADVLAAALTLVSGKDADTLAAAIDAFKSDRANRARSLAGALAAREGWKPNGKEAKAAARAIARALITLAPLARTTGYGPTLGAIGANPHDRDEQDRWTPEPVRPRAHWTATGTTLAARALATFATRADWTEGQSLGAVTRGARALTTPTTRTTRPTVEPTGNPEPIPADRIAAALARHAARVAEVEAAKARPAHLRAKAAEATARGLHRAARRLRDRAEYAALIVSEGYGTAKAPEAETGTYAGTARPQPVTVGHVTGWTPASTEPVPAPNRRPAYIDQDGKRHDHREGFASEAIVITGLGYHPSYDSPETRTVRVIDPETGATTYGPIPYTRWTADADRWTRANVRPIDPQKRHRAEYTDPENVTGNATQAHGHRTAERQAAKPRPGAPKKPSRKAKNKVGSTGPTTNAFGMTGSRAKNNGTKARRR